MRPARTALVALLLAVATDALASSPAWQREFTFARLLAARRYYDYVDMVLARVLADKTTAEPDRAALYKDLGELCADIAGDVRGRDAMQLFTKYVDQARKYYELYLDHPSVKNKASLASERFDVRMRVVWILMRLAQGCDRLYDDPETPKAEQDQYKKKIVDCYNEAIKGFEQGVTEKTAEETRWKAQRPQETEALKKWEQKYNIIRNDHVGARLYLNSARVELARFLKKADPKAAEWRGLLTQAIRDFKQMLLDFSGARGIVQVNVPLAEAMVLLGPENDQEAIERLDDVWKERQAFRDSKAIPCKAMFIKGSILFRQKKYSDCLNTLDEMLKARTDDFDPNAISAENIKKVLDELPDGDSPQQYDKKAVGGALLLEAEAYAELGKQAEDARKPGKDVRQNYAIAYTLAVAVNEAGVPMDRKYTDLMERWRKKANLPMSLGVLVRLAEDAVRKRDWPKAARLYTEILAQSKLEPDKLRATWDLIGKCYYSGKEYYEAYTVFTALADWFPTPEQAASDWAAFAVLAAEKQAELTKSDFDKALIERAKRFREDHSPYGPGGRAIQEAVDEREKENFARALAILQQIRPDHPAYPFALYQLALTYKALLDKMPEADQKRVDGQRALKTMLDAFQAVLDLHKKRMPELQGEEHDAERKRLIDIATAALTIYVDIHLRPPVSKPLKALELTDNLTQNYPGIGQAPTYGVLVFNRMHAAYVLVRDGDAAQGAKYLPVIEDCWKVLQAVPEFRYLDKACGMGADAYGRYSKKLEELQKTATDAAAKADLDKRIVAARDRGLEFYLELVQRAPRQTIRTYRYIIYQLETRPHEPKSADLRKILEIAPKAIELHEHDRRAADDVLQIKATLGIAYCKLDSYRSAIPVLEEIDGVLEAEFQKRVAQFEKLKAAHERDPNRVPKPKSPQRRAVHLEVRQWLALSYLEANQATKYKDAEKIYADHLRLYQREAPAYWENLYWLCETLRREGNHTDALGQIERASFSTGGTFGDKVVKGEKGTSKDFRDLTIRIRSDVERLPNSQKKADLLASCERILKQIK